MSTEEFVLIPRHRFIQEQRPVSQILRKPEIQNPAKQLSLLHSNSKQQIAQPTMEFGSEQQTDNVTTADKENQSMMTDNISSQVHYDIVFLRDEKFQKAKKILKRVNESQIISIDDKVNLNFSNQDTQRNFGIHIFARITAKLVKNNRCTLSYTLSPKHSYTIYL